MKKYNKILFSISIILITAFVYTFITNNPPEAKKKPTNRISKLSIEIKKIITEDFTIFVDSYGLAKASTQTNILAQVSGKVAYINKKFTDGAYFKKGTLLLQIEDTEYKADVQIAQAALALAQKELLEEKAQGKQATQDWKKFNIKQKPSALVLRVPQLKYAKANLLSAKAQLQKTKIEFNRTKIYAPYDGRVVQKDVSISQVVSNSTQLGTIYASNSIEVRLPIKSADIKFLNESLNSKENIKVEFSSKLFNNTYEGEIVGIQSSIDTTTKQFYLISKIKKNSNKIQIGEYLKATIKAKKIIDAIKIPNNSIYHGEYVYIEKDGLIFRKEIETSWSNATESVVTKGLNLNDNIVTTKLGKVSSGTKVKVVNIKKEESK